MEKYQRSLIENIRKQITLWFETELPQDIPNLEVYRFLHSVTGTAGTIGLQEISDVSRYLFQRVKEDDDRVWQQKSLRDYLMPLLSLCNVEETREITTEQLNPKSVSSSKPLVLLIDDDTTLLMYLKEELEKQDMMVIAISDLNRAILSLYDLRPECVVIDVYMKSELGFDILTHLKETMHHQLIPVVMMSVHNSKETRIRSFQMGADDFIGKPFDVDELIVRIKRQLERKSLIDQLVLVDELTRVHNRKYLITTFEQLKNNYKESFSLAILDIDHFKKVNDTYGHHAGDDVLKEFAQFIKGKLKAYESIVRLGGEEFVLLLPKTGSLEAKQYVEGLQKIFSEQSFTFGEDQINITFSSGIVEVQNNETSLSDWLKKADSALYEAKSSGRNCVRISSSDQTELYKKQIRVGIVDDDPIIRTMLTEIVDKLQGETIQLDIQSFKDGLDFFGSDWYTSDEPYIIILDGIMPKMDGLEILQRLRNERSTEQYIVVMLTSRKSENDISRALQLGADDYLTKPFNLLELEARLKRFMQRLK
ncbi:diguanylate cyclase [Bacillus sp. BGMRC 2118]|nr:diguanylate cyclase [Bacillus sp. BGMRC 2118]